MSHIHQQDLPALMKQCKEAIKSALKNDMRDTFDLLTELYGLLCESCKECQEGLTQEQPKALNLESRLDLAAQWVAGLRVDSVADCRAMASEPFLRWAATVTPDRIGNAQQTFVRYADSPADAISLALADAAEWVKKQKDIK